MRTVMLARTETEGRAYARQAGLRPPEYVLVAGPASLHGLRLTEDDLVFEFPNFRDRPDADRIVEAMKVVCRTSAGAGPRWERAQTP